MEIFHFTMLVATRCMEFFIPPFNIEINNFFEVKSVMSLKAVGMP